MGFFIASSSVCFFGNSNCVVCRSLKWRPDPCLGCGKSRFQGMVMFMFKIEKNENLKNNIRYLMRSRGETRLSLCNASGLTRTTIYNILEGRVVNVQQSTIRKISDFFGVSYEEIETVDFEEREVAEDAVPLLGDMNPAAVPVIGQSRLVKDFNKRIGDLITIFPLTYYFGVARNLIGVSLEANIDGMYDLGDLLIVKKGVVNSGGETLMYSRRTEKLYVISGFCDEFGADLVVGSIIEERFNGRI